MRISKEMLSIAADFYVKGNSLMETAFFLAKQHGQILNPNTLGYHLKKLGVSLRDPRTGVTLRKRKHIDADALATEYAKTKSLRKLAKTTGISRNTIKKILSEEDILILTNDQAIQSANLKYQKQAFNDSDQEKAYLYGFVVGDVHVFKRSKFTLRAITHTTHKTFVDLFTSLFEKYGHVNCKYRENRDEWGLFVDLDYESFKFLEDRSQEGLPAWINNDNLFSFLAGLLDSDGTIMIRKAGRYFQQIIRFFGENKMFLAVITQRLRENGFAVSFYRNACAGETRVYKGKIIKYNQDYYIVEICRKRDVLQLLKLLPVKHKEKIARRDISLRIYEMNKSRWDEISKEVLLWRKQQEAELLS